MIDLSRPDVLAELLEIAHAGDDELILVAGSLVEGFGNETSDIDLIRVVFTGNVRTRVEGAYDIGSAHVLKISKFRGIRVDTEIVAASTIEGLLEDAATGRRHPSSFSSGELTLMNNLRNGLVLGGSSEFVSWRAELDWAAWREMLLELCELQYRGVAEDADGAIEAENLWSCHYSTWQAVDIAAAALTVAYDCSNVKAKWRVDNLVKYGLGDRVKELCELSVHSSFDRDTILPLAKRRLLVAQRWMLEARSI